MSATSEEPLGSRRLRVALPGIPNFVHLPAHLAHRLGLFHEDLDVEIVRGPSGFGCFQMVQSGAVDIAWTSTVGLLRAAARGAAGHLRMFLSPVPRLDIQVGAVAGIDRCEDFRGKPVAVQGPGTFTHAMLGAYLARCGIRLDEVVHVEASPDRSGEVSFGELLADGSAIGCVGHADDLAFIRHVDRPDLHILANAWEYLPEVHYAGFVTNTVLLRDHREVVEAFASAVLTATRWLTDPDNRDEILLLAASITTQPAPVAAGSYEMYVAGDLFACDVRASVPPAMLRATAQHQVELGNIEEIPRLDVVVDRSIWQSVAEAT